MPDASENKSGAETHADTDPLEKQHCMLFS